MTRARRSPQADRKTYLVLLAERGEKGVLGEVVWLLLELVKSPLDLELERVDGRRQVGDELETLALLACEGGALGSSAGMTRQSEACPQETERRQTASDVPC